MAATKTGTPADTAYSDCKQKNRRAFTQQFYNIAYTGHSSGTINSSGSWTVNASNVVPATPENRPGNIALPACTKTGTPARSLFHTIPRKAGHSFFYPQ